MGKAKRTEAEKLRSISNRKLASQNLLNKDRSFNDIKLDEDLNFPTFTVEGVKIPRVILGTNPFGGFTHFSKAQNKYYRRIFNNPKAISDIIVKSVYMGVNAIIAPAYKLYMKAIEIAQKETGKRIIVIGTPFKSLSTKPFKPEAIKSDIDILKSVDTQFCFLFGHQSDDYLRPRERIIEGAKECLSIIRDAGMIPGIGCHNPLCITISDERKYDTTCYFLPINKIGYYMNFGEEGSTLNAVKAAKKPVFAIKPLASGRIPPQQALEFVFSVQGVKGIAIGIGCEEEMDEDYRLAKGIIESTPKLRVSE